MQIEFKTACIHFSKNKIYIKVEQVIILMVGENVGISIEIRRRKIFFHTISLTTMNEMCQRENASCSTFKQKLEVRVNDDEM